jgi:hypothetical protein
MPFIATLFTIAMPTFTAITEDSRRMGVAIVPLADSRAEHVALAALEPEVTPAREGLMAHARAHLVA